MRAAAAFKKTVLLVAGTAMQSYGNKIDQEQEVLSYLADILIETVEPSGASARRPSSTYRASNVRV